MAKRNNTALVLIVFLVIACIMVDARISTSPPDDSVDFLIKRWEDLPFKHQRANSTWASYVNTNLDPISNGFWDSGWDVDGDEETALKCLSYAAATTNDWFSLQSGKILNEYQNFINNRIEDGTNPREVEAIYPEKVKL